MVLGQHLLYKCDCELKTVPEERILNKIYLTQEDRPLHEVGSMDSNTNITNIVHKCRESR